MSQTISVPITDNVSDTLFIPLYMRSLETRRSAPVISDPLACELVECIDYDFTKYEKSSRSQLGTAIRIRCFDQAISDFVAAHDDPVVVSLGAGLDTRFQRVHKGKGVFYELDLPEVIEFRRQLIPESEKNPYIAMSMFDTAWIGEIRERHPDASFILVAEGVFMYFDEAQIKPLIVEIAEGFGQGGLHFDVSSPWAVRNSHRHDTVKKSKAVFKWGLEDDREIQNWSQNLRYTGTTRYFEHEKWRWGMMGVMGRVLPPLKNAFRMLHYEFTS